MAYAKATLISDIRRVLNDNPYVDTCTEAMDASETDLDVASTTPYAIGDVVEFQDDGEQCYVTALADSDTLTVRRGFNGTTATTHSISAAIVVNPVFQFHQIEKAITNVLRGLYPYVYREVNYTLTTQTDGNYWYELDDGGNTCVCLELSSVVQEQGTGATSKIRFYNTGRKGGAYPAVFQNNLPTAKVASGTALYIPHLWDQTNAILVNGIALIDDTIATTNYTHLTAGIGIDCVVHLACAELVRNTDVSRTTQEDVIMGDQSLPPLSRARLAALLEEQGVMFRRQWTIELERTLPRMRRR